MCNAKFWGMAWCIVLLGCLRLFQGTLVIQLSVSFKNNSCLLFSVSKWSTIKERHEVDLYIKLQIISWVESLISLEKVLHVMGTSTPWCWFLGSFFYFPLSLKQGLRSGRKSSIKATIVWSKFSTLNFFIVMISVLNYFITN